MTARDLSVQPLKLPRVFVVGNIKGGAGKTTCAMHLIAGLLDAGFRVASIDADKHQHSLTTYIQNRKTSSEVHPEYELKLPIHHPLSSDTKTEEEEAQELEGLIRSASMNIDVLVIDTPGSFSQASLVAHSYADTILTPVNDSFLDLDLLAKVDASSMKVTSLSFYSELVWKQKLIRAQRDGGHIDWVIVRNRLSNLDAKNKRAVAGVVEEIARRVKCKVAPGFGERVIFRELFLHGMTLMDTPAFKDSMSMSHVAARQELRNLFAFLGIDKLARPAALPMGETGHSAQSR